jgi:hypothetical protein
VVDELILVLLESTNDTLKGGGDIGEVGNTTTYNENLAIRMGLSASEEVN